ncbi:integrase core domain-containing protein [Tardiphaga sp. 619_E2_N8_5]|uniref:integrase core domain-containing protein n=1 Tax=unclassified Tardiphaga TaxID=2631404 RepID=UPI003F23B689
MVQRQVQKRMLEPFLSLDDARQKMEDWRRDYNEVRPHSAIGNKAPISLLNGSSASPPA